MSTTIKLREIFREDCRRRWERLNAEALSKLLKLAEARRDGSVDAFDRLETEDEITVIRELIAVKTGGHHEK